MYSTVDPTTWGTPSFAGGNYNYSDDNMFIGKLFKKVKKNLKGTKITDVLGPIGLVGTGFRAVGADKIADAYKKVNDISTGVGAAYLAGKAGGLTGGGNENETALPNELYEPYVEPEMEDLIPGIKNQHAAIGGILLVLVILGTLLYNR